MKDNHKQITTYLSKLVDTFYKGSTIKGLKGVKVINSFKTK